MAINGFPPIAPLSAVPNPGAVTATGPSQALGGQGQATAGAAAAGADFSKFLADALQQVNALQQQGEAASAALVTGQVQDVHTVMLALEKASLSLGLTVEVRNKVLDAYNQIMRMQI